MCVCVCVCVCVWVLLYEVSVSFLQDFSDHAHDSPSQVTAVKGRYFMQLDDCTKSKIPSPSFVMCILAIM